MSADRLPCGASVDDLVDQVADGAAQERTPHQDSCPHCQAALAEYDRLLGPVRELAAEPVSVPDTVLAEVLRRIRGSLPDAEYGVLPGPRGATRISGRVVAVTARIVTEQVPGVRVALARNESARSGGTDVEAGVSGAGTAVRITLAADYGADLHALADQVRTAVAGAVHDLTGLETVQIDVTIDDVIGAGDLAT